MLLALKLFPLHYFTGRISLVVLSEGDIRSKWNTELLRRKGTRDWQIFPQRNNRYIMANLLSLGLCYKNAVSEETYSPGGNNGTGYSHLLQFSFERATRHIIIVHYNISTLVWTVEPWVLNKLCPRSPIQAKLYLVQVSRELLALIAFSLFWVPRDPK